MNIKLKARPWHLEKGRSPEVWPLLLEAGQHSRCPREPGRKERVSGPARSAEFKEPAFKSDLQVNVRSSGLCHLPSLLSTGAQCQSKCLLQCQEKRLSLQCEVRNASFMTSTSALARHRERAPSGGRWVSHLTFSGSVLSTVTAVWPDRPRQLSPVGRG